MREIKFRGKMGSNSEWTYGDLVHDAFNGNKIFPIGIQAPGCYPEEVIHDTIGQFTGLHDKNGKEIYEGDIVTYGKDLPNTVVYKDCCFGVYLEANKHMLRLQVFNDTNKYEVIGNIHEATK